MNEFTGKNLQFISLEYHLYLIHGHEKLSATSQDVNSQNERTN